MNSSHYYACKILSKDLIFLEVICTEWYHLILKSNGLVNGVTKEIGVFSIMVIIVGNGHVNPSSNSGQGCLSFTWY